MSLMISKKWDGHDVAGWWQSEKLRGFRCRWDGEHFHSREGFLFNAPEWFKTGLPKFAIDGELFSADGGENHINRVVNAYLTDWSGLTFHPFAVPSLTSVEDEIGTLRGMDFPAHVQPVQFSFCESTEAAIAETFNIAGRGGEGIVLRKPRTRYIAGLSSNWLKLKPHYISMADAGEHFQRQLQITK